MSRSFSKTALAFPILVAAVVFIYGSHLHNSFQFDDFHAIVQNPYVRDIHNVPRFFVDSEISSVLPANRSYRPVLFASLAVDYRLGHGLAPLWFHLSTLIWFVAQIALIFVLSRRIFDRISPETDNRWPALFAAAVCGLHPVMAETVNYVIQRADLQSTLGVVAGLVVYICFPRLRKYCLYLLPVAIGILSKPPALVFPVLLFLYIWLIEEERPVQALWRTAPSIAAIAVLAILTAKMVPASFNPGAASAWGYRIAQPLAMLRYFTKFFVPTGLSADTDHQPLNNLLDDGAIQGFLFVAALIGAIAWSARRRATRPIAFGLAWFLVALVPTSLMALAEVENDHRMFFPFVGLAIAAPWAAVLQLRRRPLPRKMVATACLLLLAGFGYGAWQRCEVWKTEESLWRDVAAKSPHNGRGLMNYGLALMTRGDYAGASSYFDRATAYLPNYYVLEINRGVVASAAKTGADAESHFRRAIELAPFEASPKYYYARWLHERGQYGQAAGMLRAAIGQNPSYMDSYYLLMQDYFDDGNNEGVRAAAQQTLARFPADPAAQGWLTRAAANRPAPEAIRLTPEAYLNQSLAFYRAGKYAECIDAARKALALRPGFADAWNNIAAAYNAQSRWDEGIQAGGKAVQLDPKNQLAKNNLGWARSEKAKMAGKTPPPANDIDPGGSLRSSR
jgi:protein O-mannosyl-transferase